MSLRGLRRGEWLVVVALVALVVSFVVHWFSELDTGSVYVLRGYGENVIEPDGGPTWTALGLPWSALVVLAGLAMLVAVVQAARAGDGRPTYGALATVVVALPIAAIALLGTAFRVLVATPALHVDSDLSADATLEAGSWIGLGALLLGVVGLWVALADDRTTAPGAIAPPAPREVPPLRPAVD